MVKLSDKDIQLQYCRNYFTFFAKAVFPQLEFSDFHREYYLILHQFAIGNIKRLIVTVPPQHGKSQGSTILLPSFLLGLNPDLQIAIGSYSSSFARKFNRSIRRIMADRWYSEIFPNTLLPSHKDIETNTANEFEIKGKSGKLLTVGRGGALTGNAVDVMILDDVYKDKEEGNSPVIRESAWDWYTSVVKTRLHNDSQELIVFTRWHEEDLIGRIEEKEEVQLLNSLDQIDKEYKGWYKVNFEALMEQEPTDIDKRAKNAPLWDNRHSYESLIKKRNLDIHSFNCLYQGNPISAEGLLYGNNFKMYKELPKDILKISNYTDTADTGKDYLCSICYIIGKDKLVYVTDIIYTDKPMEETEIMVSEMLKRNDTRQANIESNNGGRGFARTIKRLCPNVAVNWFHQSANKESRITTNAASVIQNILMPEGWYKKWPELFKDLVTYKRDFKANMKDDAPDVLTGIIEKEIFLSASKILVV